MKNKIRQGFLAVLLGVMGCSAETVPWGDAGDLGPRDVDQVAFCSDDEDCALLPGTNCQDGVCRPINFKSCTCNYECDKTKGEVCSQENQICEVSPPPLTCRSSCDCYEKEMCFEGTCVTVNDKVRTCPPNENCHQGEICKSGVCIPERCKDRLDCASELCLVCRNFQCVVPPAVCRSQEDCCVGFTCNFGSCVPDDAGCLSDKDCTDPDFPKCGKDKTCVQECLVPEDCPLPGQICLATHCVTPGCKPEDCQIGQYCDISEGKCKSGCDSDDDCIFPESCNFAINQCVDNNDCCRGCPSNQYCDSLSCQCVDRCKKPEDCPEGFICQPNGKCWCTEGSCPVGTHCETSIGDCIKDNCQDDKDCPPNWTCNQTTGKCTSGGFGVEGDSCLSDMDCNQNSGLLCDSSIFLLACLMDATCSPTFTCLYQCSMLLGTGCPAAQSEYECKYRHYGFKGLCIEKIPEEP